MTIRLFVAHALLLSAASCALAEEKPAAANSDNAAAEKKNKTATPTGDAEFDKLFTQWRDLLARLRALRLRYAVAKPPERKPIEEEYAALVKQGEEMEPRVKAGAERVYEAHPGENPDVLEFLHDQVDTDMKNDNYEEALRRAKLLMAHGDGEQNPKIYNQAGVAAFCVGDYDDAQEYLSEAANRGVIDTDGRNYLDHIGEYRELWAEEQKFRAAEAEADDLPRVLLKTSKGDVVVELFENEAPNTVANFVSLVEKGFYDGLAFHRVLSQFMAQGGDPKGDSSGGPGYTIRCECVKDPHRNHFRGSLSMAHAGRDTGGSQFFLMFRPSGPASGYDLNGKHTVFGRIVEGIGVLARLQRIDPEKPAGRKPDRIVEAKVLRKRDHDYQPETLPGR